jgi:multidrug resistance efflux pump
MLNASLEDKFGRASAEVARLRRFSGTPAEFWPAFISAAGALANADRGILILKDPKENNWKKLSEWSQSGHADRTVLTFNRHVIELGQRALKEGSVQIAIEQTATSELKHYAIGVKLALNRAEDSCVAAFLLLSATEEQVREAMIRAQLVADTPASYLQNHSTSQARSDVEKFAASLDVLTVLNAEKKFLGATIALCNAVASRYSCDRVSIGWLERAYIKLKSISRTERFDKNMDAVKSLELTMEECLDQDDEILFPAPDGASTVSRDHEKYATKNGSGNICSIPIRLDGSAVAVLTCERQERAFTEAEARQLRLACDQAARRLSDLHELDGWFGVRLTRKARAQFSKALGPENTWMKVGAIAGAIALGILFFVHFNYRVEGNFILKSDVVSFVTAPFDGFIKEVPVRPGDQLKKDQVLLRMDQDDLALEEANALAEQVRYLREAEKARATNGLAEMRISQALADQSKARLDMTRHRLAQSSIRASFDGVVVEGDLRERLGAPIKQGDALFKISRMEGMFVEAEINQRDVHEFKTSAEAQISFVTQPKSKYRAQVERIYPAAFNKEGENIFIVRLALRDLPEEWWRPGMSGLVKVEAGERTLFWILTHRTVDFLRMWLWW